jgi:hypothetical protein
MQSKYRLYKLSRAVNRNAIRTRALVEGMGLTVGTDEHGDYISADDFLRILYTVADVASGGTVTAKRPYGDASPDELRSRWGWTAESGKAKGNR